MIVKQLESKDNYVKELILLFLFILYNHQCKSQDFLSLSGGLNYKNQELFIGNANFLKPITKIDYNIHLNNNSGNWYFNIGLMSPLEKRKRDYQFALVFLGDIDLLLGYSYKINISNSSNLFFTYNFLNLVPIIGTSSIGITYTYKLSNNIGISISNNLILMGLLNPGKLGDGNYGNTSILAFNYFLPIKEGSKNEDR